VAGVEPLACRQVVPRVLADVGRIRVDADEPQVAGGHQDKHGYGAQQSNWADAVDDSQPKGALQPFSHGFARAQAQDGPGPGPAWPVAPAILEQE
jgi:hypothetical protein